MSSRNESLPEADSGHVVIAKGFGLHSVGLRKATDSFVSRRELDSNEKFRKISLGCSADQV